MNFNSVLLIFLHREVDCFYSRSFDTDLSHTLVVERKLSTQYHPNSSFMLSSPKYATFPKSTKWFTFHKSSFHNTINFHVLKNPSTAKTLFSNTLKSSYSTSPPYNPMSL
jgi:hypothetical protein